MSEQARTTASRQFLTFALAQEEYGMPIARVREIIRMTDITAVPSTPAHVKGFINLRGRVIPVVDLRLKFGLPLDEHTDRTRIIVGEVEHSSERNLLGMIVDSVSDVLSIGADDIDAMPGLSTGSSCGVARLRGTAARLLDLDTVLSADTAFGQAA